MVKFPDYQDVLSQSCVANYAKLSNQLSPMKGLLQKVTHNYASVLGGNTTPPDPFDDWTQEINNWVILAEAVRDAGMEGIFYDNEEYNVHIWQYPANCKYASTKTASQYQQQWRLRGQQVAQAILAQWPTFKMMHLIGPNRSVHNVPAGAMFQGDPNWMGGYFFMGMFAGAPGHIINGGELYYNRTVSQFANWLNFNQTTSTQPPQSPPLIPSLLFSTWQAQNNQSFGIYDQDTVGSPAMTPSVLQQTITNALPYVNTFVWNYSENLDWLTPGAGASNNWIPAVWNARHAAGLPDPGATSTSPTPSPTQTPSSTPTQGTPVISNVQVSNITGSSAIISWNVAPASTGQVEYGTSTSYGHFTTLETNHLTFHRQSLSGLNAGTLYHFRIHDVSQSGASVPLVDRTFSTSQ